jgi:hypothetical protein
LSHASKVKRMRHICIQQNIGSARCKTQVVGKKNSVVLIPFTECLWDDTYVLPFSAQSL